MCVYVRVCLFVAYSDRIISGLFKGLVSICTVHYKRPFDDAQLYYLLVVVSCDAHEVLSDTSSEVAEGVRCYIATPTAYLV